MREYDFPVMTHENHEKKLFKRIVLNILLILILSIIFAM
jgi:hypothetical protein